MPSLEQIRRQKRIAEEQAKRESAAENNVDGGAQGVVVEDVPANDVVVQEPEVQTPKQEHEPEPVTVDVPVDEDAPRIPASSEKPAEIVSEDVSGEAVSEQAVEEEVIEAVPETVPAPAVEQGNVPDEVGDAVLEEEPAQGVDSKQVDGEFKKKRSSGGSPGGKKRGRKGVADDFKEDGTIRVDLPSKLVTMARSQFPEASNNTEAVAAWIYAKSDKVMDVPESIKRLAATYTGDQMSNLVKDVSERLAVLDARTIKMQMLTDGRVQEMWYMLAYLMLERMDALSKTHMKDLDLTLPIFDTLRAEVNGQFRKVRNRQQIQDGRQVYQRKVGGKRTDIN